MSTVKMLFIARAPDQEIHVFQCTVPKYKVPYHSAVSKHPKIFRITNDDVLVEFRLCLLYNYEIDDIDLIRGFELVHVYILKGKLIPVEVILPCKG